MCKTCFDEDRKTEVGNIRELAAVVGGIENVAVSDAYVCDDFDIREFQDTCLCPADVERTLLDAGLEIWRDNMGEIYFHARPVSVTPPAA